MTFIGQQRSLGIYLDVQMAHHVIANDIALDLKSWNGMMYGMMNVCES